MPDSNEPLPSLDELQRRIDAAAPKGGKEQADNSTRTAAAKAMRVATDLLAGVGVGGFIGYFLDRACGTSPWLFIIGFFIGFAAGVRNVLRSYKGE